MRRCGTTVAVAVAVALGSAACGGAEPPAAGGDSAPPTRQSPAPAPSSTPTTGHSEAAPTLGLKWDPNVTGYGQARPIKIDNNGDPTGTVTGIHWSDWGGATAHGRGTAIYVPADAPVAEGREEIGEVVAFDLGTCGGHPAYRGWNVYFPKHGESFTPQSSMNACTGP